MKQNEWAGFMRRKPFARRRWEYHELSVDGRYKIERRTLERVNRGTRRTLGNFESFFLENMNKKFESGFVGSFVKFPFRKTPWNWIGDVINFMIWNYSQKLYVRPLPLARSILQNLETSKAFFLEKMNKKRSESGFIGSFVKFSFGKTPWNLICD